MPDRGNEIPCWNEDRETDEPQKGTLSLVRKVKKWQGSGCRKRVVQVFRMPVLVWNSDPAARVRTMLPQKSCAFQNRVQLWGRNSYSSITAATAILPSAGPSSILTTRPLHCTRILSVSVISGGSVRVKPIGDPCSMGESR